MSKQNHKKTPSSSTKPSKRITQVRKPIRKSKSDANDLPDTTDRMILSERAFYLLIGVTLLFTIAITAYSYVLNSMLDLLEIQLRLQSIVTKEYQKDDDAYLFFTNHFPLNSSIPSSKIVGQSFKPEQDMIVRSITLQVDSADLAKLELLLHRFDNNSQKELVGQGNIVLSSISKPSEIVIELISPVELLQNNEYLITIGSSSTSSTNISYSAANTVENGVMYTYDVLMSGDDSSRSEMIWVGHDDMDLLYELH